MNNIVGNWRTSLIGVLAGVLNYFDNLGPNLPSNGREWGMAFLSAVLAALGFVAKDASVGSKAQ